MAAALLAVFAALAGACGSDGGGGTGGAGGTGEPVACDPLGGAPNEGDACASPGELCDIACSNCQMKCGDDQIWHEVCWSCPTSVPANGEPCDPCVSFGDCVYPVSTTCGTQTATASCDPMTSSWQVEIPPCP
jgi:hypothetical protein